MAVAMMKWLKFFRAIVLRVPEGTDIPDEEVPGDHPIEEPDPLKKRIYKKKHKIMPIKPMWMATTAADYGRNAMEESLNVDQVPFNLENGARKLFVQARGGVAQISGNPQGEKRFGTLQLCIHGGIGAQVPLCMLFRGKGGCVGRRFSLLIVTIGKIQNQ